MNEPSLNPSSEQELESRITAVVLGEASDFERDQIDRLIEQRPDLAVMKARFESVHRLLHDVGQEQWPVDDDGDWKLPGTQRNDLLDVLSGKGRKTRLAAAPGVVRPAAKLSRFAKIGALVCAACLLVVLGLSIMVPSVHTAREATISQADPMLAAVSDAFERPSRDPAYAFERSSGSASSSGMGGMGGGMGGMRGGTEMEMDMAAESFDLPADATPRFSLSTSQREGKDLGMEIAQNAFDAERKKMVERSKGNQAYFGESLSKSLVDSVPPPPNYAATNYPGAPAPPPAQEPQSQVQLHDFGIQAESAGRGARQSSEVALGLSADSKATNGLADRSSSISSRQAMGEMRHNGRLFSGDNSAFTKDAFADAATKPQSGATEQEERSFNFAEPSSWEKLSLGRSQLLETAESDKAPEIKVERAESKGRQFDEVQADELSVAAGVHLSRSNREAISELSVELYAPDSRLQAQEGKKVIELEQLFRATDKRDEKQTRVDFVPESIAATDPFSTFSLHVSDVSFKLAAAALAQGQWPETDKVRIEEFVNALDYGDPLPRQYEQVAGQIEQCIDPFVQQRNLLRVSLRTAAAGRASTTPLRLTLLLDNSGSMERMDRQQTVRRAFETLTQQLQPGDQITLISFARTPRLLADRVSGEGIKGLVQLIENLPSEGGTNIEAALQLAWEKAREQWTEGAQNRIILLTDGAVNLGDANPTRLSDLVTTIRESGIAFDAAGISANGLNDEVLEALTRKGDGRYYLLDSAESVDDGFARQIAGALRPSAMNVKVQVEFNPQRVGHYRLLGFEKHRLNKEDFRNDQVDAAEMAAAEAGVAVYQFEPKPDGEGDVGSVSVRFRDMSTGQMVERRWPIVYQPNPPRVDQATASMRLATVAAMFAAKLAGGPLGGTVDLKTLSELLAGLPPQNRVAVRVRQLEQMIQQAREISGG